MNAPKSVPKNKIKAGINLNPKIIKIGAAQAPEIPHPKPKKEPHVFMRKALILK